MFLVDFVRNSSYCSPYHVMTFEKFLHYFPLYDPWKPKPPTSKTFLHIDMYIYLYIYKYVRTKCYPHDKSRKRARIVLKFANYIEIVNISWGLQMGKRCPKGWKWGGFRNFNAALT